MLLSSPRESLPSTSPAQYVDGKPDEPGYGLVGGNAQTPAQSAPPFIGSQESVGSSTHFPLVAHLKPANPPHIGPFLTQMPASSHFIPQPGFHGSSMHTSSAAHSGRPVGTRKPPHDLRPY